MSHEEDFFASSRDPQSSQAHTPQLVVHHVTGAQRIVVEDVYPNEGPEHAGRCGVQSTSDAVTCAGSEVGKEEAMADGGAPNGVEQSHARHRARRMRRLMQNVRKTPSGCWVFNPGKGAHAYGRLSIKGKMVGAHRIAWELFKGPLPPDTFVCHRCDVPRCVNPDHLFVGSAKDNVHDMAMKGRHGGRPTGKSSGPKPEQVSPPPAGVDECRAEIERLSGLIRDLEFQRLCVSCELERLEGLEVPADTIDDGEMPVSEWLDWAACAPADPFEKQTCRGCSHEMEPSERGRGFCRCCREEDDERFRVSAPIPNDNEEHSDG